MEHRHKPLVLKKLKQDKKDTVEAMGGMFCSEEQVGEDNTEHTLKKKTKPLETGNWPGRAAPGKSRRASRGRWRKRATAPRALGIVEGGLEKL